MTNEAITRAIKSVIGEQSAPYPDDLREVVANAVIHAMHDGADACGVADAAIAWMVKVSQYPALIKIMNFGKHKGTAFADAPTDYLEWIRDKSEMDKDTKFTAGYWLRRAK